MRNLVILGTRPPIFFQSFQLFDHLRLISIFWVALIWIPFDAFGQKTRWSSSEYGTLRSHKGLLNNNTMGYHFETVASDVIELDTWFDGIETKTISF